MGCCRRSPQWCTRASAHPCFDDLHWEFAGNATCRWELTFPLHVRRSEFRANATSPAYDRPVGACARATCLYWGTCMPTSAASAGRASTGIPGLDDILGGGLTPDRFYLVEGTPGTGKTTLALQFLLEGVRLGQPALYITLSETADELRAVAKSHGWSLDGVSLFELVSESGLDPESEQSVLHPSEVELGETVREVMKRVDDL